MCSRIKDRSQLEKDLADFIEAGGKIVELPDNYERLKREKYVRRALFYSIHHQYHAERLGMKVSRLKLIQRAPSCALDDELDQLYDYFYQRNVGVAHA